MKIDGLWTIVWLAVFAGGTAAQGQMMPAGGMPPGYGMGPGGQPMTGLMSGEMPRGRFPIARASYMGEGEGYAPQEISGYAGEGGDSYAGGGEYGGDYGDEYCPDCGRGRGADLLDFILPYGEGGLAAPRWFDVYADAMLLSRDKTSRRKNFVTLGPGVLPDQSNVVLSTDSLDWDDAWGFRAGFAVQTGASGNLEFGYMGQFSHREHASVQATGNNLFSAYSDFGVNINYPLGFDDSDRIDQAAMIYSSSFGSYELNYRRRKIGENARVSGSWLAGVRYFQLDEDFQLNLRNSTLPALGTKYFTNTSVYTNNALTGLQIGGDRWLHLIPGLRIGGELKAGLYGNHAHQITTIFAKTIPNGISERTFRNSAAFLAEANLMCTYRVNYHWTIRGGYNFMFVDGVALAIENFNPGPPFVANARQLFFNDNGNVFYHGGFLGAEYIW